MQLEKACCPCCVGGSHVARSPPYEGYPASTLPYAALTVMAVCVAFACFVLCVVCTARATTILILHCLPMDNASRSQKGSSLLSLSLPLHDGCTDLGPTYGTPDTPHAHTRTHTRSRVDLHVWKCSPVASRLCPENLWTVLQKARSHRKRAQTPLPLCGAYPIVGYCGSFLNKLLSRFASIHSQFNIDDERPTRM